MVLENDMRSEVDDDDNHMEVSDVSLVRYCSNSDLRTQLYLHRLVRSQAISSVILRYLLDRR